MSFLERSCITVALCAGVLGAVPVLAGQRPAAVDVPPAGAGISMPGSVVGGVWDAQDRPVPGIRLRLRNVVTGSRPTAGAADEAGRFSFTDVANGLYVVEVLGENGKLLTVSHTFSVGAGETVATFVRLGAKVPGAHEFFRNAASAVVLTAAAAGVSAIGPEAKPCSSPSPGCD